MNQPVAVIDSNLKPERARSHEAGAKRNVLAGSLLIHGALFGTEVRATGRAMSRQNLLAGNTFQESGFKKSNDVVQPGQKLDNAPRHTFIAWARSPLPHEPSDGGGVQYVDTRKNTSASSAGTVLEVVFDDCGSCDAASGQRIPGAGRAGALPGNHSF